MSADQASNRPPWRALLCGRWAVSLKGWLLVSALMQWPSYTRVAAVTDLPPAAIIAVGVVRALAAGAVLLAADRTYLRRRAQHPAPLALVLLTWLLAGLTAAGVLAAVALSSEPGTWSVTRWLVGAGTFVIWSALPAYYFALQDHWLQRANELSASRHGLEILRRASLLDLESLREQLRRLVAENVLPRMLALKDQFAAFGDGWTRQDMLRLAAVVDDESRSFVRDVSHEVAVMPPPATTATVEATVTERDAARAEPLQIGVVWTTIVVVVTLVPIALSSSGDWITLAATVGLLLLIVMLVIGAFLQSRVQLLASRVAAWTVLWTAVAVTVAVTIPVIWVPLPLRFTNSGLVIALAFVVFALSLFGSLLATKLREIRTQAVELADVVAESAVANVQLQEDLAEEKRRVAMLLHGPVQGRLAAVSLLLKLQAGQLEAGEGGFRTQQRCSAILDQVIIDLNHLIAGNRLDERPLGARLENLIARWTGLAEIVVDSQEGVMSALSDDPSGSSWVFDIVEEGINNAVTHGDAQHIEVGIEEGVDEWIVTVRDDGRGLCAGATAGMGLASVGRPPGRWSLDDDEIGCVLHVAVPMAHGRSVFGPRGTTSAVQPA